MGKLMGKGFIGPIGDDLPSLIAVMLALGLFFSGIVVALNTYNQKISSLNLLQGGVDMSRALLSTPVFHGCSAFASLDFLTESYGVGAEVNLGYWEDSSEAIPSGKCDVRQFSGGCASSKNYITFAYFTAIDQVTGQSDKTVYPAQLAVKVCSGG